MTEQEIKAQKAKAFALFGVGLAALIAGWVLPSGDGVLESLYPVGLIIIGFICMVIAGKMARQWNTEAATKQAAQAGRKARIYALIGCGIATFVIAYQFAITAPHEGPSSLAMPVVMAGIGLVCFIIAGITAVKISKESAAK